VVIDLAVYALDGVITRTAGLHAAAWKRLFDDHLTVHAARTGGHVVPVDIATDYRAHVDGELRHAGIRDFFASREIRLPEGSPRDDSRQDTVHGLGKRKNRYFLALSRTRGCGEVARDRAGRRCRPGECDALPGPIGPGRRQRRDV
jgi:beta-phosphoglucomutase-like phosphatase (HAD superfamily)